MKKNKYNILLLIVVAFIVLYFSLSSDFEGILKQLVSMNIVYVLLAILLMIMYWFIRSIILHRLIIKFKPDYKFRTAFKLKLSTQFFNAITPFASGGQPFQILVLKREGVNLSSGTNIVIQNFIIYQVALILLGIFAIIFNNVWGLFPDVGILKQLVTIGFIVNTLVTLSMFLIAFNKRFNKFIVDSVIKLLSKVKIVKNTEKKLLEWQENLNNFNVGAKELMKNKGQFAFFVLLDIIALASLYLVPLMVLYGTGDYNSFNALECIIAVAYVMLMGSFVPLPGGTGGLEYGFTQFFGNFISSSQLMAIMLVWRFITYYLGLFIGAIAFNIYSKEK